MDAVAHPKEGVSAVVATVPVAAGPHGMSMSAVGCTVYVPVTAAAP
ncbi:MAG TPA: hypothetical protein VLR71_16470 [Casimicrobiaceae bacterium]|nr:hypothetical protein [Casimicrobiaceae bacterium]